MSPGAPRPVRSWPSLLGFGGAPSNGEEARAFLQRRIALFYGAMAWIGWGFYSMSLVTTRLYLPGRFSEWLLHPTRVLHLLISLAATGAWAFARGAPRSLRVLESLDVAGATTILLCIAFMMLGIPAIFRPEIETLFVLNVVLVARAAIVPSTPARSSLIGAIGVAAVTLIALHLHRQAGAELGLVMAPSPIRAGASIRLVPPPEVIATLCIAWGAVSISLSALISRVIYGLHRKIEEVLQLGQYRIDEKIGEGGMGVVYRASHAMLRRPTAIKLLHPGKAGEGALARFEREVQNTAKLTHQNTVAIYDYGRTPGGLFYYAMEYLDGFDLETLVTLDGPQLPARVIHVLKQVVGALAEAHRAGLVHRDIKPANIILCQRGGVADFAKVVDFGLVKDVSGGTVEATTVATSITGTPLYMSPEGIVSPDRIDGRSDLYALGAVAYYLLTGVPVFTGATVVEVCAGHLHGEVIPPSQRVGREVPPSLEVLLLACLAKKPEERPASAESLLKGLSALEVPLWTPEDAGAWWTTHAEDLRARRSSCRSSSSPLARTVGVDFAQRDEWN
jgi:eukaryotic-like serine/threonine-protein kinase